MSASATICADAGCTAISKSFPNATVAEYGMIDNDDNVVKNIQTEIFVRGYVRMRRQLGQSAPVVASHRLWLV